MAEVLRFKCRDPDADAIEQLADLLAGTTHADGTPLTPSEALGLAREGFRELRETLRDSGLPVGNEEPFEE